MKNILIIVSVFLMLFSCKKDETTNPISTNKIEASELKGSSQMKLITVGSSKMLSFSSWQDFENRVDLLEAQLEAYDDQFLLQWGHLSDSLLDDVEDSLQYDPEYPLKQFENGLGFTNSYRKSYNTKLTTWLNSGKFLSSTANDPDGESAFSDEESALLNSDQQVVVGGILYQFTKTGYYKITSKFSSAIQSISAKANINTMPHISMVGGTSGGSSSSGTSGGQSTSTGGGSSTSTGGSSSSCTRWSSSSDYLHYSSRRRVKRIITYRSLPWYSKSKARIVHYKKRGNKWKRRRGHIGVAVQTYLKRANDCSGPVARQGWSGWKTRRRRSVTRRLTDWGGDYTAKKGFSVIGNYRYGSASSTKIL